ncbi:MAG: hypothetical protein DHS20C08_12680 [Rhodomicrobium sp.]|nr:MAG: hypothetical protein DHS20C08_12680 [Rhodomicrobium sp.]
MGELMNIKSVTGQIAASATALLISAGIANAADLYERHRGSMKDAPVVERERPKCGANVALTTDYIFRGETQSGHEAAIQGGFDCDYRMFYAGVWASSIDGGDVDMEIDVYGGIKHKFGGIEADLGVIYYAYPDANDAAAELDYVEVKFGLSGNLTEKLGVSGTVYWSDDYYGTIGETWVLEGGVEYAFGTYGRFTPTFSALIGYLDDVDGAGDFTYWNAGVEIGFDEKFALDLRYWDTDQDSNPLADERFVATISASF